MSFNFILMKFKDELQQNGYFLDLLNQIDLKL